MRMNFPSDHPLYEPPGAVVTNSDVSDADVILGLEVQDLWSILHKMTAPNRPGLEIRSAIRADAKVISISAVDMNHKSNYQDFGRYVEANLAISGDAEATLPALIEAVKKGITPDRRRRMLERGARIAEQNREARQRNLDMAVVGWDASPITTARLSTELWRLIKHEDWSLVSYDQHQSSWPTRLWNFTKHYQFIGPAGAYGIGYGAPAAVGAALANRKYGRLSINIQGDGDLNYTPAVLWTAAHHKIPLLTIVHNNRAYHEERMQIQFLSGKFDRGIDRADIGTALTDPDIDYTSIAKGYGLHAEGPISDPEKLGPAIQRGIELVKKGEPVLIDVVSQGR
jgi:thiamine pyrophosphate-dependent acetolactate synthase large subunit-like protein